MASEEGSEVDLYIYDLTHGLASALSASLIGDEPLLIKEVTGDGHKVEGVWHTAVVVYGTEYFYGDSGIVSCPPGTTQLGRPLKVERLGTTSVTPDVLRDYLQGLSTSTFTGAEYHLLEHNCNHFSEELAGFLCGAHVPKYILQQPQELPPHVRQALLQLHGTIASNNAQMAGRFGWRRAPSPDYHQLNQQVDQARCGCSCGGCECAEGCCGATAAGTGTGPPAGGRGGGQGGLSRGAAAAVGAAEWVARAALLLASQAPVAHLLGPAAAAAVAVAAANNQNEGGACHRRLVPSTARGRLAAVAYAASRKLVGGGGPLLAESAVKRCPRHHPRPRPTDNRPPTRTYHRQASQALEARRHTLAEKLARRERRKEKKRKKRQHGGGGDTDVDGDGDGADEMAEAVEAAPPLAGPSSPPAGATAFSSVDERRAEEERRRAKDPPIVYKDIDGAAEFEALKAALAGVELSESETQSLDELQQYLVAGEGSWVLGDDFLAFIGRILSDSAFSSAARVACLRCLASCALRDDVALLLHQDRRHHALLAYAHQIDRHPEPEQEATALFLCNLFEHISSSEWLLYISEWDAGGQMLSNIRATTKVCVHALLAEQEALRELGTALMYNLATKEVKTVVFDEVCAELALALLQLLGSAPSEEHLWRCTAALARLAAHAQDVPQLIALVGPDPSAYRGTSPRVDEQIDLIMQLLK